MLSMQPSPRLMPKCRRTSRCALSRRGHRARALPEVIGLGAWKLDDRRRGERMPRMLQIAQRRLQVLSDPHARVLSHTDAAALVICSDNRPIVAMGPWGGLCQRKQRVVSVVY